MTKDPINLFYAEPEDDRWFLGDRYPRRIIRRILRGQPRPGGQQIVYRNLIAGLNQLGVTYRQGDFGFARRHPDSPVGIIGKPHLLDLHSWTNPILLGASIMSHPLADPDLPERVSSIKRILVPGDWMRDMFQPYWGNLVHSWPVGIDTDHWTQVDFERPEFDFLVYDKIRWEHGHYEDSLLKPIRMALLERGLSWSEIRYGSYVEDEFHKKLDRCRAMIFLCEHETQGLAYQQALARGVPILAWDRRGEWKDPEYFPDRVSFGPVSSVPYWDERCGRKFDSENTFGQELEQFLEELAEGIFSPRDYIMENLTLIHCARHYLAHWKEIFD